MMLTRRKLNRALDFYQHFVDNIIDNDDEVTLNYDMLKKSLEDFASSGDFKLVAWFFNPKSKYVWSHDIDTLMAFYNEFIWRLLQRIQQREKDIYIRNIFEQEMTWNSTTPNIIQSFNVVTIGGDKSWD